MPPIPIATLPSCLPQTPPVLHATVAVSLPQAQAEANESASLTTAAPKKFKPPAFLCVPPTREKTALGNTITFGKKYNKTLEEMLQRNIDEEHSCATVAAAAFRAAGVSKDSVQANADAASHAAASSSSCSG